MVKDWTVLAMPNDLVGKTAAIIAADEFEDLELFHPMYRLQEEGIKTMVIGLTMDPIKGKKGYSIKPNASIDEVNAKLRLNQKILRFVKDFDAQGKPIAAICHAGQVLASAGVVKNRTLTCVAGIRDDMINAGARYIDKGVVIDRNLVTSRVPSDLPEFARAMIETFRKPQLLQAPRQR